MTKNVKVGDSEVAFQPLSELRYEMFLDKQGQENSDDKILFLSIQATLVENMSLLQIRNLFRSATDSEKTELIKVAHEMMNYDPDDAEKKE